MSGLLCTTCRRSSQPIAPSLIKRSRRLQRQIQTAPNSAQTHLDAALDVLPKFTIKGENLRLLKEPSEFHDWLTSRIAQAKKRIFLSTLYLGKEEHRLVETIHGALAKNPELEFYYIADMLRSTREQPNPCSASLLAPLKAAFPDRVFVSFYHTPALTGLTRAFVPKRFNEGFGLWHAKLYGVDDEVMVSGANLSRDYFTNRQDRYMAIQKHPRLADYFHMFILAGQSISYNLAADDTQAYELQWPPSHILPEPTARDANIYKGRAERIMKDLQAYWLAGDQRNDTAHQMSTSENDDTQIRPFLQIGQFNIREETQVVIPSLFNLASDFGVGRIDFTSGYFSMTEDKQEKLLDAAVDELRVICASPPANGFYNSAGVSKYIPPAYTRAEQRFWNAALKRGLQTKVELREWLRQDWTYHSKGIWLSATDSFGKPFATVIGSSNYGPRSASRDVELNMLVTTTNDHLKTQLGREVENLREHTEVVTSETFKRPERVVLPGVRLAAWLIKDMF